LVVVQRVDVDLLTRVLLKRAGLHRHDRWSVPQLKAHQVRALGDLRRWTYASSAFYARHHAGLFQAPLSELPPVTKADLMAHFDEVVTAPGLRLDDVERRLRFLVDSDGDPGRPWRGRWWVAATSGTTGRRGVFVWDKHEWSTMLASYARASDWAQVRVGLAHPVRVAVVSSRMPTHQSAVLGASLASRLVPTLRLDASAPMPGTVAALNAFAPRILVGYPSALRPLALEQLEGRLRIFPESVMSASEVLSDRAADEMTTAWGAAPSDVYAATETAAISSPCVFRRRHVYEDLVIIEPVDADGQPVPAGTLGSRIWVTVLFSRTVPLIRYELSDQVVLDGRGCPCGRPFGVMVDLAGRDEDVLVLPSPNGPVRVHPNVFHSVLDEVPVCGWQVVQEADVLRVLLAQPGARVDDGRVRADIESALRAAGVPVFGVRVERVDTIPRTAMGKAPLVRRGHWGGNGA